MAYVIGVERSIWSLSLNVPGRSERMQTYFGFIVRCSYCGGWHTSIDPEFDCGQCWDYCPMGCGLTPHSTDAGLDASQYPHARDDYDVRPVPEV